MTDKEQESKKIIIMDNRISYMLSSLYKTWRNIETDSRRPKRASGPAFAKKLKNLKDTLEMPLNITKVEAAEIIHMSGIKDWQEEVTYLDNQLSRSQVGCPSGFDFRQRKRDNRIIEDMTARARVAPKCLMCLKKNRVQEMSGLCFFSQHVRTPLSVTSSYLLEPGFRL